MNFELLLVLAVFATGIIWLIDRMLFAPGRRDAEKGQRREPVLVEYARAFFPVLLVVLLLRSFVVEPFRIPSGSMMPSLLVGDFILVNKFDYGLRLPVAHTKIVPISEPERGDVVVFRYPKNPEVDYIKRVVGLPGDRIRYEDKQLYINGRKIPQEKLGVYEGDGDSRRMLGASRRLEKLDDVEHEILVRPVPGVEGTYEVPEDHYFVMGDNRDNSNDSRYWGFVPEENLVGKAFMIWMHWDMSGSGFRLDRIGDGVN